MLAARSNSTYGSPTSVVYADSDLDWDGADDWNSGGADGDLFTESYNANTGLSGVGRVSSPAVASRTGYAGYQWDGTINAYHVRHRVYMPEIGRWTRRDPLGYVDGMGLYEYIEGQAFAGSDPLGLDSEFVGPPHPCDVFAELYNLNQLLEAALLDNCGFDDDLQAWYDAGRFTGGALQASLKQVLAEAEKGARKSVKRSILYKARARRNYDWGQMLRNAKDETIARRLRGTVRCAGAVGDVYTIAEGVCTGDYGEVSQGVCSHLLNYLGTAGRVWGAVADVAVLVIESWNDRYVRQHTELQRASRCALLKRDWEHRQQALHQAWADCWSAVFRWPWSK